MSRAVLCKVCLLCIVDQLATISRIQISIRNCLSQCRYLINLPGLLFRICWLPLMITIGNYLMSSDWFGSIRAHNQHLNYLSFTLYPIHPVSLFLPLSSLSLSGYLPMSSGLQSIRLILRVHLISLFLIQKHSRWPNKILFLDYPTFSALFQSFIISRDA